MMSMFMFALLLCGVFGDELKSVSVMEGDFLTLHSGLNGTQRDAIQWRFGPEGSSSLLVQIVGSKPDIKNFEGFKDRLQISNIQTGDLIIKNMKKKHTGLYKAVIDGATGKFQKIFNVTVNDAPGEIDAGTCEVKSVSKTIGDSVTLNTDVNLQKDALILWRFGNQSALIAKDDMEDNKTPEYPDVLNGSFKGRLKVNDLTGDLIIKDLTYKDFGVYKLKISSNNKETIHKTFSVSIRGGSLSTGVIVLICFLAILALVGVLAASWYRRRSSQLKVREIFVREGESVTLSTADIKGFILEHAMIEYKYRDKKIAEMNRKDDKSPTYDGDDERLMLDDQTGNLTISDLKIKHSGLYQLKITSSKGWPFSILGASYYQFNVIVMERIVQATSGYSVTLHTDVKNLQKDDLILWMCGAEDTRIAKFTVGSKDPVLYLYTDDIFRNGLQINPQTGDLTIKGITPKHCELYKVMICTNQRSTYRDFKVSILVPAEKGKPVNLKTGAQTQRGDQVKWSFRDPPLKRISCDKITLVTCVNGDRNQTKYKDDKRFKGRLEMKAETGDLTITNIRETDEGVYTLQQCSTGGKITNWIFSVLLDPSMLLIEGETVTLPGDNSELQTGVQIEWKFKDNVIISGRKTKDEGITEIKCHNQKFNGRLELNPNFGALSISNISKEDTGYYEIKITDNKETSDTRIRFKVIVSPRTNKNEPEPTAGMPLLSV